MGHQVKLLNQIGRGTKRIRYRGYPIRVIENRRDTFRHDNNKRENKEEQDNMCIKTSRHNIVRMEQETTDLHINGRTIKKSFGTSSMYKINKSSTIKETEEKVSME